MAISIQRNKAQHLAVRDAINTKGETNYISIWIFQKEWIVLAMKQLERSNNFLIKKTICFCLRRKEVVTDNPDINQIQKCLQYTNPILKCRKIHHYM